MPNFNIVKESKYKKTFRNESIKGQFDLHSRSKFTPLSRLQSNMHVCIFYVKKCTVVCSIVFAQLH